MVLTARMASSGAYIPRIKKPAVSGGTKEGGSGLRVRRLKHKTVIVCEVPHICPLVERISCAARTTGTRIRTLEQSHARPCNRVLKVAAALRADRHGRNRVTLRKPQAVTSPVGRGQPHDIAIVIPGQSLMDSRFRGNERSGLLAAIFHFRSPPRKRGSRGDHTLTHLFWPWIPA